jgi:hypothetical protein
VGTSIRKEERIWEASREKLRGWLQHGIVKPEVSYFSESTRFLFCFVFARYLLFFVCFGNMPSGNVEFKINQGLTAAKGPAAASIFQQGALLCGIDVAFTDKHQ